jgi:hypothetical protein
MAQQPTDQTGGAGIQQAQYTGVSDPQFVGGSIDPNTGSLLLPTQQQYAQGQTPPATSRGCTVSLALLVSGSRPHGGGMNRQGRAQTFGGAHAHWSDVAASEIAIGEPQA